MLIHRGVDRNITFERRLAASRPYIRADPYEHKLVLLNLLMHSREAEWVVNDDRRRVVRLRITDNGEGLLSDMEDCVRSPFTDPTTSLPFASPASRLSSMTSTAGSSSSTDRRRNNGARKLAPRRGQSPGSAEGR